MKGVQEVGDPTPIPVITPIRHVLEIASGEAWVLAQSLDELSLVFPDNLKDIDMSGTSEDDVKAVESK